MKKFVGIVLLCSWIPFLFAIAFDNTATAEVSSSFYTLTGTIWVIFGTWAGILLIKDEDVSGKKSK